MRKGKLIGKLWKFIALMRKGKLIDRPWKLIALIILEVVVFGLAFWLTVRFFPTIEAVHNAIVIVSILAVGITIIIYGNVTGNRKLNILGFAFFLFAIFVVIDRYEGFAVKISAFAALAVAFAAFAAIDENRRIRQDSVERESRERKGRLIDEVAKWLRDLEGRIFPKLGAITSGIEDKLIGMPKIPIETWFRSRALDVALGEANALDEGIREAKYYQKLTSQLNEELSSLTEVIVNNLEQRRQIHTEAGRSRFDYSKKDEASQLVKELIENDDRPLEGLGLSGQDIITVRFGRNAGAIRKSILKAVDKAIELKTSFIQVS